MKIQWFEDSGGNLTCHTNEPHLLFKESLIGKITHRGEEWFAHVLPLNGDAAQHLGAPEMKKLGPFRHVAFAMEAMRVAVGGDEVDPWDR